MPTPKTRNGRAYALSSANAGKNKQIESKSKQIASQKRNCFETAHAVNHENTNPRNTHTGLKDIIADYSGIKVATGDNSLSPVRK